MQPLNKHIVIKPITEEQKTESGIIIPVNQTPNDEQKSRNIKKGLVLSAADDIPYKLKGRTVTYLDLGTFEIVNEGVCVPFERVLGYE